MSVPVEELRRIDLFDEVSDEGLAEFAAITPAIQTAEEGDILLEQGADSPGPLLMFDGGTRSLIKSGGGTDLGQVSNGATWIGAIAAVTESALPVTIEATSTCRYTIIPRAEFIELAIKHRSVHRKVMKVIGPVMRGINSRESSRERLTSLGTMAAGLAHELNNPAAAARRAASDLVQAMQVINYALRAFVEAGIEREDAEKLLALQKEALERSESREASSALDESDAIDAMEDILDELGITEGYRFSEPLASAGLDEDWVRRVIAITGEGTHASLKALWWVASTISAQALATELVDSTDRMSKLVKAIKTYAYMDRGGVIVADVHEGIDSTLIMLKHKIKHTNIKVERHYDQSLPQITMHGSELNQVWTNILDNALGALGEDGTITITTGPENGCIKVDIADDGPGIPEDVRSRIFDPFFTTKAPGSGTGMGLDTARRIVEQKHGGSLTFDTSDAGTTFHIWLPLEGKKK
ncbi:HAMP domain-containing histidine kinase [Solirubrobacter phytolaccae]|uniref:histidine kinase n=1 Tax=Solirubrobacter phytolaccae TaxID=1404360 RepID=A0A9X3NDL0_9ACTN|nr:ATP-binding protein [Solirubrobacter phytolaccae]MDA0184154.1 HAMP domain-containing histidine kinase [Solirubrobacter phytolaccae]